MAASDTRSKRTFVVQGVNRSVMAGSVQELGPAADDRLVTQVMQVVAGLLHDGCRSRRRSPVGQRLSFQVDKGSLQALERHLCDSTSKRQRLVAGGGCSGPGQTSCKRNTAEQWFILAASVSCRVFQILSASSRTEHEAGAGAGDTAGQTSFRSTKTRSQDAT
jgi:hypothetical protein